MEPLLIRDSDGELTTVHFGIQTKPGESLVMIKQESQAVLISKENWPEIREGINRSFSNQKIKFDKHLRPLNPKEHGYK